MTWLAGVGSATIQKYLGTVTLYFLVPLSVPSVLFLARLTRYSAFLCEMELKSFKRSWKYEEALPNLAHVIRSGYWLIVDDCQFTDDALSCFTEQIIKVSYCTLRYVLRSFVCPEKWREASPLFEVIWSDIYVQKTFFAVRYILLFYKELYLKTAAEHWPPPPWP